MKLEIENNNVVVAVRDIYDVEDWENCYVGIAEFLGNKNNEYKSLREFTSKSFHSLLIYLEELGFDVVSDALDESLSFIVMKLEGCLMLVISNPYLVRSAVLSSVDGSWVPFPFNSVIVDLVSEPYVGKSPYCVEVFDNKDVFLVRCFSTFEKAEQVFNEIRSVNNLTVGNLYDKGFVDYDDFNISSFFESIR